MFRISVSNAQAKGARSLQEDAFGSSPLPKDGLLADGCFSAIVADGIGGLPHGEYASRIAVQSFLESCVTTPAEIDAGERLFIALEKANTAVYTFQRESCSEDGLGTTMIAVSIHSDGLDWISVGDSHLYLFRDGTLTQLNTDHVYLADLFGLVNSGLLSREEAMLDPRREALTSYIGDQAIPQIDRNQEPMPLRVGDTLLLCSDGVYDFLSREELSLVLADSKTDPAGDLIHLIEKRRLKHQDNATAIVIGISSNGENA